MRIDILTLFPNMFTPLFESIVGRAVRNEKLEINIIDIRNFSKDKHKKCDDAPFGGGAGMVMMAQPIYDAVNSVVNEKSKIIITSPSGKQFNNKMATDLAKEEHLIFICGHYEGIDQRIIDIFNPLEISIGDYILTGGELPSMVMIDSISRQIDGVIAKNSLIEESFSNNTLEYPQYTRPQIFNGLEVPSVLLSGNHKEIEKWRKEESLKKTKSVRPDLINSRRRQT